MLISIPESTKNATFGEICDKLPAIAYAWLLMHAVYYVSENGATDEKQVLADYEECSYFLYDDLEPMLYFLADHGYLLLTEPT